MKQGSHVGIGDYYARNNSQNYCCTSLQGTWTEIALSIDKHPMDIINCWRKFNQSEKYAYLVVLSRWGGVKNCMMLISHAYQDRSFSMGTKAPDNLVILISLPTQKMILHYLNHYLSFTTYTNNSAYQVGQAFSNNAVWMLNLEKFHFSLVIQHNVCFFSVIEVLWDLVHCFLVVTTDNIISHMHSWSSNTCFFSTNISKAIVLENAFSKEDF